MAIPPNSNGSHNNFTAPNATNGSNASGTPNTPHDESSDGVRWDLQELQDGEFQHYFREHEGRLFHSHGGLPYPLPVDGLEHERLNALHLVLGRLLNQNFVGPVHAILAPVHDRRKLVLDFCNGTGQWVMEMASQFPHVQFDGLDIAPITTRRPHNNVRFELHDVNTPVRWLDGTVDFVHARDVSMALLNYVTLVQEAARVLRPGGLFLSGEWDPFPAFNTIIQRPNEILPATYNLIHMVNQTMHQKYGIVPVGLSIPSWLEQSGQFENITPQVHFVPIGDWSQNSMEQTLGNDMRAALVQYGDSVIPMLKEAGYEEAHLAAVLRAYVHELHTVPGLMAALVQYGDSVIPMLKEAGYEEAHLAAVLRAYVHELHTVPGLMAVYRTVHATRKAQV